MGDYYNFGGIETIDVLKAKLTASEFKGFLKGNVLKYMTRAGKKDVKTEKEDYKKALYYLKLLEDISVF